MDQSNDKRWDRSLRPTRKWRTLLPQWPVDELTKWTIASTTCGFENDNANNASHRETENVYKTVRPRGSLSPWRCVFATWLISSHVNSCRARFCLYSSIYNRHGLFDDWVEFALPCHLQGNNHVPRDMLLLEAHVVLHGEANNARWVDQCNSIKCCISHSPGWISYSHFILTLLVMFLQFAMFWIGVWYMIDLLKIFACRNKTKKK